MKFTWKSVVMMPVLMLPVVMTQAESCPDGISGTSAKGVCCPTQCTQCTGSGCSTATPDLGSKDCCASGIRDTQQLCTESKQAPCILDDDDDDGSGIVNTGGSGYSDGKYAPEYSGDGTYYGYSSTGNCAFFNDVPSIYDGMHAVAVSSNTYDGSEMCGACIVGTASGEGEGDDKLPEVFEAYVSDQCPECNDGDLDFAMPGDGRYDISWKFVECPNEDITFVSPSANPGYWKLQPRGTETPVETLTIGGVSATRSQDNHFEVYSSDMIGTQTVEMETLAEVEHTFVVTLY